MAQFKDHKISAKQLLEHIPEELMAKISARSEVDHYSKVLHGKKVFYLLLYGILENDRMSQRSLEDTFNDRIFKMLFKLDPDETVRRSSISERLSKIDTNYFKEIYEELYTRFSKLYTKKERLKMNILRVDSTMLSEGVGKLSEYTNNYGSKKAVKLSLIFDGELPGYNELFTSASHASEDVALPAVIMANAKQEKGHQNVYVMDRGVQSARAMKNFSENDVMFVARLREDRKFEEVESLIEQGQQTENEKFTLLMDSKVKLNTYGPVKSKEGKVYHKTTQVETPFRLIVIKTKSAGRIFSFITNDFQRTADEISEVYRRRWDIEVFFRFLKQELNMKHLISLNPNGIRVVLYMTLIAAMIVLMYKKHNGQGYKTSKRRLTMEIRDMVMEMVIIMSGGNPNLIFKMNEKSSDHD